VRALRAIAHSDGVLDPEAHLDLLTLAHDADPRVAAAAADLLATLPVLSEPMTAVVL
jgi:hypothetical protein